MSTYGRKELVSVHAVTTRKGTHFEVCIPGGVYLENTPERAAERVREILPFVAESMRIAALGRLG